MSVRKKGNRSISLRYPGGIFILSSLLNLGMFLKFQSWLLGGFYQASFKAIGGGSWVKKSSGTYMKELHETNQTLFTESKKFDPLTRYRVLTIYRVSKVAKMAVFHTFANLKFGKCMENGHFRDLIRAISRQRIELFRFHKKRLLRLTELPYRLQAINL